MVRVILSLGSNLGNKKKILKSAVSHISMYVGKVERVSNIYESEPWGFSDSRNFYNIAISIYTDLKPIEILKKIQLIEKMHKRKKSFYGYQARTLDIDIIFYGNSIIHKPELNIPHTHAHERKFVLLPIIDIDKNIKHPEFGKSVIELFKNCSDNSYITVLNNN